MDYLLLGPLEVISGDGPVKIPGLRQRVVLAMLLLQVNQSVPLERLVDAVWDDDPPSTAKAQIQTCVSVLRRRLSTADRPEPIKTSPSGYRLSVSSEQLDIARFESLVASAYAAMAEDRPVEAVAGFRGALSLWRGPAAAGLASSIVQAAATRLNERRLTATEQCIELELQLGRHRELMGELSELVVEHPLREELRGYQMIALYRSGRQADALESFRRLQKIFREELGLDPGPKLCDLERAILANDRRLQLEPPAESAADWTANSGPAVPRQLPAAVPEFTGRDRLLKLVGAVLTESRDDSAAARCLPIVALSGKGGVGKTAIAVQVCHALSSEYHDGQLFAQMREADGRPVSSSEQLARFLRALGLASSSLPSSMEERTASYRSFLADRHVLIVLDDANDAAQVTPLLPGGANCAVIVTSRNPLPGLCGARHFEVDDLDLQSSIELISRIIGAQRVESERPAASRLAQLCGCLPLALRIAAAKLAARPHWRIAEITRRLADEGTRLNELAVGGLGIRGTLSLSFDSLEPDAQQLLVRLGLLGTVDFAAWVCAPLLDAEHWRAVDLLDQLVEAHLIEVRVHEDRPPRYRLHELIRVYALEHLVTEPIGDRAAALERLLGCWLGLAEEAHRRMYGGDYVTLHGSAARWRLPDDVMNEVLQSALGWFRAEHAGLVSAVLLAGQAGLDELCWDLAMTAVSLFETDCRAEDWRRTHEIALEAARKAGNTRGEAAILYSLGNLAIAERISHADKFLGRAISLFDQLGDTHGRALTLALLAFVDRLGGDYERAAARYEEALACFVAVTDPVGQVDALVNLAQIRSDREDFVGAEILFDQALGICRGIRSPRITAQAEYRLGEYHLRRRDLARAERSFRFVLDVAPDTGDRVGEVYALQALGLTRLGLGQLASAEADLSAALSMSKDIGDNLARGRVLVAFAEFYLATGQPKLARSMIDDAQSISAKIASARLWHSQLLRLQAQLEDNLTDLDLMYGS
jgi:DNA-binding SARP family transcriptional activator/tetratricopeptide (TPR) repeat protein